MSENNAALPLGRFPYVHVQEPEIARHVLGRTLGPLDVDVAGDTRVLDWRLNRVDLGPVVMLVGRTLGNWILHGEASYYLAVIPRAGQARLQQPNGSADLAAGKVGAVVSPSTRTRWEVATEVSNITARIDRAFLEAQLEALTGVTPRAPLSFAPRLLLESGRGASLTRLLQFLMSEIEGESTALESPIIAAALSDAVVRSLLVGQPHSASHLFERPAPGSGPRWMRVVEEYLQAHATEPVRMSDLAGLTGTSVRSIQAAFRAHRGYSPMAFLRKMRMELARRALLAPSRATSVTSVAYDNGFSQPAQFSVDYRKRFGERPSETLRRGRSLMGL